MRQSGRDYWQTLAEDTGKVIQTASGQIGNVLKLFGTHNYEFNHLDLCCGLGVMTQMMVDAGFRSSGIDPEDCSEWWDFGCAVGDPRETLLDDKSFDIVTCYDFSRFDNGDGEKVLDESRRLAKKFVMVKPYERYNEKDHREWLGRFMDKRFPVEMYNHVLNYYTLGV